METEDTNQPNPDAPPPAPSVHGVEGGSIPASTRPGASGALFGLVVIWASLFLVSIAQNYSYEDSEGQIELVRPPLEPHANKGLNEAAYLQSYLFNPVSKFLFQSASPRLMVERLCESVYFSASQDQLDRISDEPRSVDLKASQIWKLIFELIDDPALGFGICFSDFFVFDQQWSDRGDAASDGSIWKGSGVLGRDYTTFFLAAGTDYSATLWIDASSSHLSLRLKDGDLLLGSADANFTGSEPVRLTLNEAESIEAVVSPSSLGPDLYDIVITRGPAESPQGNLP